MRRPFVVLNPEKPTYPDTWWQKHALPDSTHERGAFFAEANARHPDMAVSKEARQLGHRPAVDELRQRKSA